MTLPEVKYLMKMLLDNFGNKQLEEILMLKKSKLMKFVKLLKKAKIFLETDSMKFRNRLELLKEKDNTQLILEFPDTRLKCKR